METRSLEVGRSAGLGGPEGGHVQGTQTRRLLPEMSESGTCLLAAFCRVCGAGARVSVGTRIHAVSAHRARVCPSARPSRQPRKLSPRRAGPLQGAG